MKIVLKNESVVLERVPNDAENEGLRDAEWRKEVEFDDFDVLHHDLSS